MPARAKRVVKAPMKLCMVVNTFFEVALMDCMMQYADAILLSFLCIVCCSNMDTILLSLVDGFWHAVQKVGLQRSVPGF